MKTEIIPVIHMTRDTQVLANVELCLQCGIEKVFIINHMVGADELIKCAHTIKHYVPKLWVGLNMLGIKAERALKIKYGRFPNCKAERVVDGLWCDERITQNEILNKEFEGMVFGGVAFKYQPQPSDLRQACEEATRFTDVATTSGAGTGQPADIQKIKSMREYLGEHPMAIASGVSIDNIDSYKGLANYLLVATSITDKNEMIIKEKLSELKSKL